MRNTLAVLFGLTCLLPLAGCGSGDYEAKFQEALKTHGTQKQFADLRREEVVIQGPNDAQDLNISYKPPRDFIDKYRLFPGGDDPQTDQSRPEKILNNRVFPPLHVNLKNEPVEYFNIFGIKTTYEAWQDIGDNTQLPYYLYVAGVPVSSANGTANEYRTRLQAALGLQKNWENVDVVSKTGTKRTWQRIQYEEQMIFYVANPDENKGGDRKQMGELEVWLTDTGKYRIAFIWRWPKVIDGPKSAKTIPIGTWPELTASTVEVKD